MQCSLSMYIYSSREQWWCQGQGAFLERCVFLHLLSYQSHDHLRSLFTLCACPCSKYKDYSSLHFLRQGHKMTRTDRNDRTEPFISLRVKTGPDRSGPVFEQTA